MQHLQIAIVDAFVKDGQGGNPAGVVCDAEGLSEAAMQAIATKVGVSETAFVSSSEIADFKLDFFTAQSPYRQENGQAHYVTQTFV